MKYIDLQQIKEIIRNIIIGLLIIIIADMFGYLIWQLSGQTPVDGFYFGAITNYIIN